MSWSLCVKGALGEKCKAFFPIQCSIAALRKCDWGHAVRQEFDKRDWKAQCRRKRSAGQHKCSARNQFAHDALFPLEASNALWAQISTFAITTTVIATTNPKPIEPSARPSGEKMR